MVQLIERDLSMRLKIVEYWGLQEFCADRYEFECITDRHNDFINVSAFNLCEAAGLPRDFTPEQARSLIGKEFDIPFGLMPRSYLCRGTPKLVADEHWKDLGEDKRCEWCERRWCTCGDDSRPIAA